MNGYRPQGRAPTIDAPEDVMKSVFLCMAALLLALCITPQAWSASNPDHIDPCALIGKEKMMTAFPAIKGMEKQTIGPNTTCNYLNDKGISGLIVSAGRADHRDALKALAGMGDGYSYQPVSDLGDSAAIAVTKPNPKFDIKGGNVVELHVITKDSFVNLAPILLEVQAGGPAFASLKQLAAEMATKLP